MATIRDDRLSRAATRPSREARSLAEHGHHVSAAPTVTIRTSYRRYELALRVLHNAWHEKDPVLYDAYLEALLIGLSHAA